MKWTNEEKRRFANAVAGMCKGVVSVSEAVHIATSKGSTRGIISPAEWALVSAHVGTKSVKQCQDRLQSVVKLELAQRARSTPVDVPAQLPLAAAPWGVDVSPYIGAPTGRVVWRYGEAV
jgi:hypothetical protein